MFLCCPEWLDSCFISFQIVCNSRKVCDTLCPIAFFISYFLLEVFIEQLAQCSCLLGKSLKSLLVAEAIDVDCAHAGCIVADSVDEGTVRRVGEVSILRSGGSRLFKVRCPGV